MIRLVLNETFKDIKVFLERTSSSDQIKSTMFYSWQFYIQVVELLHITQCQPNIQQFPFLYHFRKKLKMS